MQPCPGTKAVQNGSHTLIRPSTGQLTNTMFLRAPSFDVVLAALLLFLQGAIVTAQAADPAAGKLNQAGESHWAFRPVQDPQLPAVKDPAWPRTTIDRFILAKLEAQGRQPATVAGERALIRRATFDLTGLPPTPEEIEAFLADASPGAFARVVERLLNSPHYGEHWGRHWLDVVRYADTAGDTADYPVPTAWRYRNYVIDAFNADKPYDEFIREQIAGDILARQGPRERYAERVTATGYLAISRRFGFDSENYHHLTIQDTIDTLGQSVMGLSLGCARCHNHKYDPVSASEYYGLYGIFESTRYAFPGSEQKQKFRALTPLLPPEESSPQWRTFEERFAALGHNPPGILRSLDDIDGDFEMQRTASGGSKGVLVPPWIYEGPVAVTQAAQSPFKHVHAFGSVGVSLSGGTHGYRIEQRLHPTRTKGRLRVNLDFRAATNQAGAHGYHRFWIGAQPASPAVEVLVSSDTVVLPAREGRETIRLPRPGQWHNLQLTLDLNTRTFSGSVGVPGEVANFTNKTFSSSWTGTINFVAIHSPEVAGEIRPGLEFDNLAVQETPLPAVSTVPIVAATSTIAAEVKALTEQLEKIAGLDGDFEMQKEGAAPAKPWHPGPNSAVKISAASQSPYHNIFPEGRLGIHLPNSGAYNGFGQTLTNHWKAGATERLFASFDFRCVSQEAGGVGSWRFHIGHTHQSASVELGINALAFFKLSGDRREEVQPLQLGRWYQVQLVLNLKERRYNGSISTPTERTEFSGEFAKGWDGSIDYAFIDSGGHLAGVKPSFDADNFAIGEMPLPPLDARTDSLVAGDNVSGPAKAAELRRQIAALTAEVEMAKQELRALTDRGPFDLADRKAHV